MQPPCLRADAMLGGGCAAARWCSAISFNRAAGGIAMHNDTAGACHIADLVMSIAKPLYIGTFEIALPGVLQCRASVTMLYCQPV